MLWFRDKAYEMKKPEMHRKDDKGNYTVENCQFLESVIHQEIHAVFKRKK